MVADMKYFVFDIKYEDINIVGYESYPAIKAEVSV